MSLPNSGSPLNKPSNPNNQSFSAHDLSTPDAQETIQAELTSSTSPETEKPADIMQTISRMIDAYKRNEFDSIRQSALVLSKNTSNPDIEWKHFTFSGLNIDQFIDLLASNARSSTKENGQGSISYPLLPDLTTENSTFDSSQIQTIKKEYSLLLMEELIHFAQKKSPTGTIAEKTFSIQDQPGVNPIDQATKSELDVAQYLVEQGIDLKGTYFITRYSRNKYIQ